MREYHARAQNNTCTETLMPGIKCLFHPQGLQLPNCSGSLITLPSTRRVENHAMSTTIDATSPGNLRCNICTCPAFSTNRCLNENVLKRSLKCFETVFETPYQNISMTVQKNHRLFQCNSAPWQACERALSSSASRATVYQHGCSAHKRPHSELLDL